MVGEDYLKRLDEELGLNKKFVARYRERLEDELKLGPQKIKKSYSTEYERFKTSELSSGHRVYEALCRSSERSYRPKLSKEKEAEIQQALTLTHINASPSGVVALATFSAIWVMLISIISGILMIFLTSPILDMKNLGMITILVGLGAAGGVYYYSSSTPTRILNRWRARASNQLVLATVYLVLYMKRDQNIERAVDFVARQIPPPLSLDFIKILWDVETGIYDSVSDSLAAYAGTWKGKEDEFIDAINLVQSSLLESDAKRADELLNQSIDVILEGVNDHMIHYAHSLQNPVRALHMLGIVLPVLTMVMLPLVGTIMGIKAWQLILLYNVALPIAVYFLAQNIVALRPGGISEASIDLYNERKSRSSFGPGTIAILLFLLSLSPLIIFILNGVKKAETFSAFSRTLIMESSQLNLSLYYSIIAVAGLGCALAAYYYLSISHVLKARRSVESIEEQFSSAVYQLGSRIEEGVPVELAVSDVAEGTKGSDVSKLFGLMDFNLKVRGMGLNDAIFDKKVGAAFMFPSPLIRSVMHLVVEGARKSLKAASESLLVLSKYLRNVKSVSERLKDLLADTLAEMQMQAGYFTSIITGIVVSLAVLIIKILVTFDQTISGIKGSAGSEELSGMEGILNIFNASNAIPPAVFQGIVGVYIIFAVVLISFLIARVEYGYDEIEARYLVAKNIIISTGIYVVITIVASMFLTNIADRVVGGLVQ